MNRTSVIVGGPVLSTLTTIEGHPGMIYAGFTSVALIFDDVDQLAAVRDKIDEFIRKNDEQRTCNECHRALEDDAFHYEEFVCNDCVATMTL